MGTHTISPFGDDEASDFVAEIVKSEDMGIIADAVYAVSNSEDRYVESSTAIRAIVAAEVIAALLGNESGDEPEELQSWIADQYDPENELIDRARNAVERVLRDPELHELWRESELYCEWNTRIRSLLNRMH